MRASVDEVVLAFRAGLDERDVARFGAEAASPCLVSREVSPG
jgi:hypothetical protein